MTPATKNRALNAGAWLVSCLKDEWEPSDAPTGQAAAEEFARSHGLKEGFVFVRDSNGREQRFKVLPKAKRQPTTGTVKS